MGLINELIKRVIKEHVNELRSQKLIAKNCEIQINALGFLPVRSKSYMDGDRNMTSIQPGLSEF